MIRLIIYGVILAAILAAFGVYHHAVYKSGYDSAQSAQLVQIVKNCGTAAKTPKDCYTSGVESVKAEFAAKIERANATITAQSAALASANTSIDRLRAASALRAANAAKAIAALESKARDAADKLAAVLSMQPTPGVTPCESACSLLRSFQF